MDYHVKPIGRTCTATGRELHPGERCVSVLVDRDGQLLRLDFAADAWNGPPPDTVGHWQCVVPQPQAPAERKVDAQALWHYFEQLSDEGHPTREPLRYVLALLLLQKRRLKLTGTVREGDVEFLELIGTRSEGPYTVRDQQLSDEEIARLQDELNRQLNAETGFLRNSDSSK